MAAGVVADGGADVLRQDLELGEHVLDGAVGPLGAVERLVRVVDVGLVVLVVVDLHRPRVDVRLQRGVVVRQCGQLERHCSPPRLGIPADSRKRRMGRDAVVLGCGNFGGIGSAPAFFGQGETREEAFALMDAAWALGLALVRHRRRVRRRAQRDVDRRLDRARPGNRPQDHDEDVQPDGGGRRPRPRARPRPAPGRVEPRAARGRPDRPLPDRTSPTRGRRSRRRSATFEELVERGLIEAWGVSNVGATDLREWLERGRPALVQNSYSLLDRGDEADVIPLCAEHGIAVPGVQPAGRRLADRASTAAARRRRRARG